MGTTATHVHLHAHARTRTVWERTLDCWPRIGRPLWAQCRALQQIRTWTITLSNRHTSTRLVKLNNADAPRREGLLLHMHSRMTHCSNHCTLVCVFCISQFLLSASLSSQSLPPLWPSLFVFYFTVQSSKCKANFNDKPMYYTQGWVIIKITTWQQRYIISTTTT